MADLQNTICGIETQHKHTRFVDRSARETIEVDKQKKNEKKKTAKAKRKHEAAITKAAKKANAFVSAWKGGETAPSALEKYECSIELEPSLPFLHNVQ